MQRLTDVFVKDPISNTGKLLGILTEQLQALEETQNRVRSWRDIDQAQGATLDRIGTNVAQARGVATDEVYRILIKSKIARNLSTGDINTIIRVLSTALACPPSDIEIRELWNDPINPEPAAISVIRLPIRFVNAAGMSPSQFGRIVQRTVAAGVHVGAIELTGTFQFAGGTETEISPTAGFSNDSGLIGGYFGAVYSPGDDADLPI
ncbi:hypothetical protein [Paenibacillus alba]|uniref:hypothetical protein n=1 Tax=Paenibacillus alba TaxID=1197127 RepID=UPI001FE2B6C2|nr:hypothetical protein [Paenibacillus alba]